MLDGKGRVLTASGAVVLAVGLPALALLKKDWGLFGVALASGALAFAYWCFEKSVASPKEVGAVAALGAIAAVSRVPFAALPNVQPTTFIVIAAGFVFGPLAGFMAGSAEPWSPTFSWARAPGLPGKCWLEAFPAPPRGGGGLFGPVRDARIWPAFAWPGVTFTAGS